MSEPRIIKQPKNQWCVTALSRVGNRNCTFDCWKRNAIIQENTEINAFNAIFLFKCKEISLILEIQEPQYLNMSITTKASQAAKAFAQRWSGEFVGEKQETQSFWIDLMDSVFGIPPARHFVDFEKKVKINGHEKYIDGYITESKVLIEQKGSDVKLNKPILQSDGEFLTPFQQAVRYKNALPTSEVPLYIVVCNFHTFELYDMNHPNNPPEVVELANLEKEFYRLSILVTPENAHIKKELEVSIKAGEIVGVLYDKILAQYQNPDDPETHRSLNKLCVRLVFCLYAEDAGLFDGKSQFHDYMAQFSAGEFREKLRNLFRILDTRVEDRDPYEDEKLLAFPYVNGGMFAGDIIIPRITEEIRTLILQRAADDFDWSEISPTIFGAVFESTLNPETRRAGGMHYTSIENIHKVIDPLFLDDLKAELNAVKATQVAKTRREKAMAFQDKLASLSFLDPACGSGNFLTESYTSLRRLENEAIKIIFPDRIMGGIYNPIKVSISQFYGIEINDFACSVAQTALWIAESQMWKETDEIVGLDVDLLPLKSYNNIHEGNALRMDWNSVIPAGNLDYIMGNPPFVGLSLRTKSQQEDMDLVFTDNDRAGRLDYVAAWYKKTAQYISQDESKRVEVSFVSTNSIVQGEQAPILWEDLFNNHGVIINFAYRTFVWSSEASQKAHVHCVIIGFALTGRKERYIYEDDICRKVSNLNAYLVDADNVFIQLRGKASDDRPKLTQGNKPWDGGFLILNEDEREILISKYPSASAFIKKYIGSYEFINRKTRYCLWLKGVAPDAYRRIPEVMERLRGVADVRSKTKTVAVQALAETPMLFAQIRQPSSDYILVPETSSASRKYIPMGFMDKDVIASNSTLVAEHASLSMFAILTSGAHMAWMRTVCGRLKSDYRYSPSVYNNFPWPELSEKNRAKLEETAQGILDARELFPNSSLADLYDEVVMPPELRRAHRANDMAVLEAYGFPKDASESDIVARLFKLYQKQCD